MPRKILYIDDDEGIRALVQRGLRREGVEVMPAANGESGLEALAQGEFDAVVVDLYMPGLSGIDTIERINRLPNPPPVIMVTGAQDSRMAVAALKAGAFDYLIKDVQGEFIYLLKASLQTAVDAMRMRRAKEAAEAEVRAARDRFEALAAERALLMREVNHRVGNSLQLISSLLTLQGNAADSPDVRAALTSAVGRVLAVAQIHRRLYTSDDVQSVSLDQYLTALIEDLRIASPRNQIALKTDDINVEPDRAVAVGVIVNELVTNALKYAYPGDKRGAIRVAIRAAGDNRATLTVEDDGIGITPSPGPRSSGLGQRIVKAMGDKLGAVIEYDKDHDGTRIFVSFALQKSAQAAAGTFG